MERFTNNLYARMQAQLQDIAQSTGNMLHLAEQSYYAVYEHLKELNTFTKEYDFKNEEEEVKFFKEIKPSFLKEAIFFDSLFGVESTKPPSSPEVQKNYYREHIDRFCKYFEQNQELYLYYRLDHSHLDPVMFVRKPDRNVMMPAYSLEIDPSHSNVYSFKFGKMMAYEDIVSYIQGRINTVDNGGIPLAADGDTKLTFTGTKAQFHEAMQALGAAGVFNNGKAPVSLIYEVTQIAWNIRVSNSYGYLQTMRIRKKNRTPFMDLAKEMLIRKMDDQDEHPRFH
jgi:hypothetical protein